MEGQTKPAKSAAEITPADDGLHEYRALYIGTAGDIKVDMAEGGTEILFVGVEAGIFPISVRRVYDTDTTADDIVGLN